MYKKFFHILFLAIIINLSFYSVAIAAPATSVEIDKSNLNNAVNEAEIITSEYRPVEFQQAVKNAKAVIENESATQESVYEAEKFLWDEISFSYINRVKIDDLIVVEHKNGYSEIEAKKMVTNLNKIPTYIRKALVQAGKEVKLVAFPITDTPEMISLRGEIPRGWEDTGLTWKDVPGVGGDSTIARIGYSETGNGHGSINLELHEIAHTIDANIFGGISESKAFLTIHSEEVYKFINATYEINNPDEYFAESFAYYFKNNATKSELEKRAPKTYKFIKTLVTPKEKVKLADLIEKAKDVVDKKDGKLKYAIEVFNNPNAPPAEIDNATRMLAQAIDSTKNTNPSTDKEEIEKNKGNNESGNDSDSELSGIEQKDTITQIGGRREIDTDNGEDTASGTNEDENTITNKEEDQENESLNIPENSSEIAIGAEQLENKKEGNHFFSENKYILIFLGVVLIVISLIFHFNKSHTNSRTSNSRE